MILPKALEAEFWQKFKQFEQERTISYITTGERIGYERGKEEGKQEGEQATLLRLLQKRVGDLPAEVREQIQSLSLEQLETLSVDALGADSSRVALLDFSAISQGETAEPIAKGGSPTIADLLNWLDANSTV